MKVFFFDREETVPVEQLFFHAEDLFADLPKDTSLFRVSLLS